MIETKDDHRSLLIPKWSSIHRDRVEDFRFAGSPTTVDTAASNHHLDSDLATFAREPSVTLASQLLNDSIVMGRKQIALNMARYLQSRGIPISLAGLVGEILHGRDSHADSLVDSQIRRTKTLLNEYPRDALLWIEQARLYTIKGQIHKAKSSALLGHSIAPDNRFVSRAAARLFVHIDEPDTACELLDRSYCINPDPMIRATQINCALLAERQLPATRRSEIESIPDDRLFFYSELLCTRGILEMRAGDQKSARRFFKRSWENPTQNVISHADWTIRNTFPGLITAVEFDFDVSPEAATWRRYCSLRLNEAIEMAARWILEEPYSTHPYLAGSAIACCSQRCDRAVFFATEGLKGNPNDFMLKNNLAFALIREGRTSEARLVLLGMPSQLSEFDRAFVSATSGYCSFREGDSFTGRQLYQDAIRVFRNLGLTKLVAKAALCMAVAEMEARTEIAASSIETALEQSRNYKDPDFLLLRNQLRGRPLDDTSELALV
jgi:hypothetical protein